MKHLSPFNKRLEVLMYIMKHGETSRDGVIQGLHAEDMSSNGVTLILKELVKLGLLGFKNGKTRGYLYFVRPEFTHYLLEVIQSSKGNKHD